MLRKKEIITAQNDILEITRRFFQERGFLEIQSPIISTVTDPGLRGAGIASIEYCGRSMKLTSSMIFHKQLAASAFGKIFSLSPNVRLEQEKKRETKKHLAEFRQIEIEAAFFRYRDIMSLVEEFFCELLRSLRKDENNTPQFKEYAYSDIVSRYELVYGEEIPHEMEERIAEEEFVWITSYPYGSRGFYDKTDETDPALLRDFDLLYSHGFGEACSGGEREYEYGKVKRKMEDLGMDPSEFKDYLDILAAGKIRPTAGMGIGLERLTRFICGLDSVEEATLFPRVPGVPSF
jgi:asparaginyl-tRNA synthetase